MNSNSGPNLRRERWKLTAHLVRALEWPMLVLSGVWSLLLVIELTRGLSPWLQVVSNVIWLAFVLQFAIEFVAAPSKRVYLRKRWITALSLALPAVRLLRIVRIARFVRFGRLGRLARATRGVRLARLLGTINRGMRSLTIGFKGRGVGYVILLTLFVGITGAAGMYHFEFDARSGPGFPDYATALWWTAMLMTTMGTDYWPQTPEGRFLCFVLALYAFAVFGYVTAAIAAYFVGIDKERSVPTKA